MLVNFFQGLRDAGVPVTTRELLDLLEGLKRHVAFGSMDEFYYFSRTCMVKDEKYFDRFDRAFGLHFKDLEALDDVIEALIPDDWLRSEFLKNLSDEEKAKIESLGGQRPRAVVGVPTQPDVEPPLIDFPGVVNIDTEILDLLNLVGAILIS